MQKDRIRLEEYEKKLQLFDGFIQEVRGRCHVDVLDSGAAMLLNDKNLAVNPGFNDFLAMVTEFRPSEIGVAPLTRRRVEGSDVLVWSFYLTARITRDGLTFSLSVMGDSLMLTSVDTLFDRLEIAGYNCSAAFEHITMIERGETGASPITLRRRTASELS